MKKSKRGFFTIAFGKHYQKIAYNLLLTAKYNNLKYPFAIITDKSNKYTRKFDVEIIRKPIAEGFLNKLYIDVYAPFDESIFIDADSLIFKDISFLFDSFSNNECRYIAVGRNINREHLSNEKKLYFGINKTKDFNITSIPGFNGGLYFYSKSMKKNIYESARILYERNDDYGYRFPGGDESYISLSMAINKYLCYEKPDILFSLIYYKNLKTIDLVHHNLIAKNNVSYHLLHCSSQMTYGTKYKMFVGNLKYRNSPLIIFYKIGIFSFLSKSINFLSRLLK